MNMTEKLDVLMAEKGLNRRELSKQSGIPYMTIINFYKKGTENVKLSTLKKIASYFSVSLDYIADDSVNNRKTLFSNDNPITQQEFSLVIAYRKANEDDRTVVDAALRKYLAVDCLSEDDEKMA